jgi:hypothetical protein
MLAMIEIASDNLAKFSIEIDFVKGVGDPSRVFRAMSDLITALHDVDRALIGTIDTKIEPLLLLEDIETGSIKSWLKQGLESVDDDALKKGDWIEDLITSEIIETPTPMIMKVKKPDFFGESMWDFKYDNRTIEVKIAHSQWLVDYQAGKIPINPGDAIKADVMVRVRYGLDGEVLSTQYTATNIKEVIPKSRLMQAQLFDPNR